MLKNFDEFQKFGKEGVEASMESFAAASKGAQTIAVECAEYARKSFEQGTSATEKLLSARSVESVIEVQTEYAKSAYEGFLAQATKIGEIYADIAKQSYRPFEAYAGKIAPTA